jgi:coproporphyrinogen III oxidase-like Fe-S oxidoreductase
MTSRLEQAEARVEVLETALASALGLTTLCMDLLHAIRERNVEQVNVTMAAIRSADTLLAAALKASGQ